MAKKKLHPSVQQFKEFVKENPKIIQEVRSGNATWQELFEEWYLLGEDDHRWDEFRKEKKEAQDQKTTAQDQKDWMPQILGVLKKMDPSQVQGHISHLSQALGAIQGVISQLQGEGKGNPPKSRESDIPHHPFHFRKD